MSLQECFRALKSCVLLSLGMGFPGGSGGKESACNVGEPTPVFLPGDPWWAAVSGITQSRTRLKRLSSSSSSNVGDLGLIPGLGRSPGEGKGYPLQYCGLENSMDYIVHGVTKSQTRLNNLSLGIRSMRQRFSVWITEPFFLGFLNSKYSLNQNLL